MAKEIMNLEEAAEYLGVSKAWLYKACKEGYVPHMRFGRRYRFFKQTLDEWMKEGSLSRLKIELSKAETQKKGKRGKKEESE